MRDYKLYLNDILLAIKKIEKYTKGLSLKELKKDDLVVDGVELMNDYLNKKMFLYILTRRITRKAPRYT